MIKRSGTNSLFNKLFPLQSDFELLTDTQRRRLHIIWVGLAIFLAFVLFVVLLFLTSRTPDVVIPETASINTTPAVENSAPAQPLDLKAATNSFINSNVDVIAGTIANDSNYITIKLQVAGSIVRDPSLPQLTVYQVGFDTDLDASTGYQLNSSTIGAEYLADFDSKGNATILHWVQSESRFESVAGLEVTQLNNNTLYFQIPRASLGYPSQVNMLLLSNDGGSKNQSFLPTSGFVNYQIAATNQAAQPDPQPLWPYTVATSQTNVSNAVVLRQPANSALAPNFDITDASIVVDSTTLTATMRVVGKIDNSSASKPGLAYYQVVLSTDNYGQNADQRLGFDAKYIIDQDANGFNSILVWNNDTANFEGVSGLHTTVNGGTLTFVLPLSSIGNPQSIWLAFGAFDTRVSQQNYLPDHSHASISTFINAYSATNTVQSSSSDQAIQLSNTNLQIADGYLNATLQTTQAVNTANSNGSYYQLLLGQPLTQTLVLTDTASIDTTALAANVIEPGLQVFYKVVFTPGQSDTQAQLYSWSNQAQAYQLVQTLPVTVSGNTIGLKIPLSTIGSGLVGYYFQTYNPQDGFNQLLPQHQSQHLLIPGSAHQVLFASSDITASDLLINQITLDSTATGVDFSIQAAPNQAKTTNLTFWIDSDLDPTTGQQGLHPALGVDYMLKYSPTLDSSHVQVYSYDQNQKTMKLAEIVPAQLSTNQLTFELPYNPDTLGLVSNFNMAVRASSAVSNQSQSLPSSNQDYARIDFQREETTQNVSAGTAATNSSSNLQQFTLNFDGFYLAGTLTLDKLPTTNDKTTYNINIASYSADPKSDTLKLITDYYLISYDSQLNRATLQHWSNDNKNYQLITQIDSVLDRQNNKIEFKFPYSLLGQPYYANYIVSAKRDNKVQSLPAFNTGSSNSSDLFTVQQGSAVFYFKNSLQNSSFVMKQNAGQ